MWICQRCILVHCNIIKRKNTKVDSWKKLTWTLTESDNMSSTFSPYLAYQLSLNDSLYCNLMNRCLPITTNLNKVLSYLILILIYKTMPTVTHTN